MCLDLTNNAIKQTATEDIVCYKRVYIDHKSNIRQHDNKLFTGIIGEIGCEGKIHIENADIYFCINESKLDGMSCSDKLGYKYSWVMDYQVKSIIVEDIDLMKSGINFITPYRQAKIQIGETYISSLNREGDNTVTIGLHSFTTYEDARNDGNGAIVKCIIPKGAEYYEGKFNRHRSYASTQLRYVEVVEE